MSELPYTDEQVRQFSATFNGAVLALNRADARRVLAALNEAGITVTFPEPRFYVEQYDVDVWLVEDRTRPAHLHACFYGPDAERFAREHADRLNREVSA